MTIIQSISNSAAYNLAFEEYFFSEFQTDFLLFYINEPSVIVGSNQAVCNEVNIDFCNENNIKIIRRKSGGGAVYHDNGNLNYSFISNKREDVLSDSFLYPIRAILEKLGIPVEIGVRKDLWLPNGSKISGTASQIRKTRELHHGTLLVNADIGNLKKSLSPKFIDPTLKATKSVRSFTQNILEYTDTKMNTESFIGAIIDNACQYYNCKIKLSSDFDSTAIATYMQTYLSATWNFKK